MPVAPDGSLPNVGPVDESDVRNQGQRLRKDSTNLFRFSTVRWFLGLRVFFITTLFKR